MSKPQVLFVGNLDRSLPEYKEFETRFEPIYHTLTTEEQLIKDFQTKFSKIEAIYGSWLGFITVGGFKGNVLAHAPKSLKIVAICSVGYDDYDGPGMAEKGIVLTNVPSEGAAGPVADLVAYHAIGGFRNFKIFQDNITEETNSTTGIRKMLDQNTRFDSETGRAVLGKTTGPYAFGHVTSDRGNLCPANHNAVIVGFGNIGRLIGSRLAHLGMNIHYVKRTKLSDLEGASLDYPVTYHKSLQDTRDIADLVVIAVPGTPETKHLINDDIIDSFSKPFRVVNIGRGSVIDEEALIRGLKSGKILYAGLDVFEQEPTIHPELIGRQDVVLTPHLGASTVENFNYTAVSALKNITNTLVKGGEGVKPVN